MYTGKLGPGPTWKRAEKYIGDYYISEHGITTHFKNKHIGFTYETNDEVMERNEYKFTEIRTQYIEAIKHGQLVNGMNYAEVLAIVQPYYKIIEGNKETWYFNDRGPIEFKNGTI